MSFWIGAVVVIVLILVWGLLADRRRRGGWARHVSEASWKARDEAERDHDRGVGGWG